MALTWEVEMYYFPHRVICGTDEAGRGPLAGPVCAAAVILPFGISIAGLDDSKKLTGKSRETLFDVITATAIDYYIAFATVAEIEAQNILNASQTAMRRAVAGLKKQPDLVFVDGNIARGFDIETKAIVGGDAISPSIAAASILAKVSRDRLCLELDKKYPEYGFASHKGYGTKAHYEAIDKYGLTPEHRKSFLVKYLGKKNTETV